MSVREPGSDLTDAVLLERFRAAEGAERDAVFALIAAVHGPALKRRCRRLTRGDAHLADDLYQDTMIAAFRQFAQPMDGPERVGAYLAGIASHKAASYFKKWNGETVADDLEAVRGEQDKTDWQNAENTGDAFLRFLDCAGWARTRLTGMPRAIFDWSYREGLDTDEIADRLGCTRTAASKRVYKARTSAQELIVAHILATDGQCPELTGLLAAENYDGKALSAAQELCVREHAAACALCDLDPKKAEPKRMAPYTTVLWMAFTAELLRRSETAETELVSHSTALDPADPASGPRTSGEPDTDSGPPSDSAAEPRGSDAARPSAGRRPEPPRQAPDTRSRPADDRRARQARDARARRAPEARVRRASDTRARRRARRAAAAAAMLALLGLLATCDPLAPLVGPLAADAPFLRPDAAEPQPRPGAGTQEPDAPETDGGGAAAPSPRPGGGGPPDPGSDEKGPKAEDGPDQGPKPADPPAQDPDPENPPPWDGEDPSEEGPDLPDEGPVAPPEPEGPPDEETTDPEPPAPVVHTLSLTVTGDTTLRVWADGKKKGACSGACAYPMPEGAAITLEIPYGGDTPFFVWDPDATDRVWPSGPCAGHSGEDDCAFTANADVTMSVQVLREPG